MNSHKINTSTLYVNSVVEVAPNITKYSLFVKPSKII